MAAERAGGLVGRTSELAAVSELVTELAAGRGRSLVIEGEPGIGKSALLAAGLTLAEGCEVLQGNCDELGQRFPLSVMVRALGVDEGSPDPRRAATARALGQPERAGGWSARLVGGDPVLAATEQLLELVDQLCAQHPLVLAVEDLQWSDESSLLLWRHLCRATAQLPLLLIGTRRPVPHRVELERLRRDVQRHNGILLPLERLTGEETQALAARLTGAPPGWVLSQRLASAAGNPLYVRELLDALKRSGALHAGNGRTELVPTKAVPRQLVSLASTIADRLDFLSRPARELLRPAALLGPDFSVADLAAVAEREPATLTDVLEEALKAGVLEESTGARIRFRHGLLKEAVYEATPTALRIALHQQAARALIAGDAPVERIAEILMPVLECADPADLDWLASNAAELTRRAPSLGADLLDHALQHMDPADARYDQLAEHLAGVCFLLARHEQAERVSLGLLASTPDPDRAGQAAWWLGFSLSRMGRNTEALAATAATAARSDATPAWRARLTALQAIVQASAGQSNETAVAQALAEGERLGDRGAMAYALHAESLRLYVARDSVAVIDRIDRALRLIGDDPGLLDLRLLLLNNRFQTFAERDRLAETGIPIQQTLALAERTGTPRLGMLQITAASLLYAQGRWDDAIAALEAVTEVTNASSLSRAQHGMLALMAAHRQAPREAARHIQALGDELLTAPLAVSASGFLLAAQALLAEQSGRPDQATQILATLLTPSYKESMVDRAEWLPRLLRVALAAGDEETARDAAEASVEEADREQLPWKSALAQWCQGVLRSDAAPVLAAAASFRASGRLLLLGNALEDAAVLHAAARDTDAARTALTEAQAVYTELGAIWDARRADARMRAHGIRSGIRGPRQRPQTGWQALTTTEQHVAELVAEGLSNPEIAGRLVLSRRTVETHVSHILAKLQAGSRHGVSRFAEARGNDPRKHGPRPPGARTSA